MDFIVTNLSVKPEVVVYLYNGWVTEEQWIKEKSMLCTGIHLLEFKYTATIVRQ